MTIVPYTSPPPPSSYAAEWLLDPAEIANRIGGTDFVPQGLRDNPAAITAALLYGSEVGLGRMASLAMIAVINGRPTLSAEAQRALVLAAGHEVWFEESTITRCVACGRRRGSDTISRVTWTIDDARRANLAGKQPWKMYPRQMLQARASAELARSIFPDVIRGLRATEELEDDPALAAIENGATAAPAEEPKTKRKRATRTSVQAGDDAPVPGSQAGVPVAAALEQQDRAEAEAIVREFEGAPSEPEPLATEAQKKRIFATMHDLGSFDDRENRLAYVSTVVGRPIESSNDLTVAEAARLIDQLDADLDARRSGHPPGAATGASDATDPPDDPQPAPGASEHTDAAAAAAAWALADLFDTKQIADDDERVSYATGVLGRPVAGDLADLTADEARKVIAHLERFDPTNPQTWPFPAGF